LSGKPKLYIGSNQNKSTTNEGGDCFTSGISNTGLQEPSGDRTNEGAALNKNPKDISSPVGSISLRKDKNGNDILPGKEVYLLIGDRRVCRATVKIPMPISGRREHAYCRPVHGASLSTYEKEGTNLVAVYLTNNVDREEFTDAVLGLDYPYNFGGQEEPPRTVGEMVAGIYAWSLSAMESFV